MMMMMMMMTTMKMTMTPESTTPPQDHRTNAMKQALASTSSHAGAQPGRKRMSIDSAVLLFDAKRWLRRNELLRALEGAAREATALQGPQVEGAAAAGLLIVAYEELQLDTPAVLHRVGEFLGLRTGGISVPVSENSNEDSVTDGQMKQGRIGGGGGGGGGGGNSAAAAVAIRNTNTSTSSGQKKSSEDLRELIANFEDVRRHVAAHAPCLLPQLLSTMPRVFEPDDCRADDITTGLARAT